MALFYAVKHQDHINTLISTGGFLSSKRVIQERWKLFSELPEKYYHAGVESIRTANFNTDLFKEAYNYFYREHVMRIPELPAKITKSHKMMYEETLGKILSGSTPLKCSDAMNESEFTESLFQIKVPTLITSGYYDIIKPSFSEEIHRKIKNSEFFIFRDSSHNAFWEERPEYLNTVDSFI